MSKEIRKALGTELKVAPNRVAMLLYPKNMPVKEVLKSLALINEDLEHGLQLEKRLNIG